MLSRERVFAAFDLEEPDTVPQAEIVVDPVLVEKITGLPMKGRLGPSLIIVNSREDLEENVRNVVRCYDMLGFDMAYLHYGHLKPLRWEPKYVGNTLIDEWGGRVYAYPTDPSDMRSGQYAGSTINTPEDWENSKHPDPYENGQIESVELAMKTVKKEVGEKKAVGLQIHDCFARCWTMRGMSNFLVDLYKNTAFAEKLLEYHVNYFIEVGKAAIDAGADIISSGDDYCDSHGPLMHPTVFRKLMLPRIKRWVNALKKHGAHFVIKHCDGDISPIIRDFIDAGFDGIHPFENMNLNEVKEKFGDEVCLIGRVDSAYALPHGTPMEVVEEVKASLNALSPGGGHILLSSNSVHHGCKLENVWTMIKAARKYGRYPSKKRP